MSITNIHSLDVNLIVLIFSHKKTGHGIQNHSKLYLFFFPAYLIKFELPCPCRETKPVPISFFKRTSNKNECNAGQDTH